MSGEEGTNVADGDEWVSDLDALKELRWGVGGLFGIVVDASDDVVDWREVRMELSVSVNIRRGSVRFVCVFHVWRGV